MVRTHAEEEEEYATTEFLLLWSVNSQIEVLWIAMDIIQFHIAHKLCQITGLHNGFQRFRKHQSC